ncbi:MAG: hypothetical protein A2583_02975 [Bdellovibrionales bacterium RIFOXYD1_FULL_53_11]|nr:MAG: hypothetical protein A2583_02975 [Bdellovibrionales bacterium RIFOXYD1_FULL_53_11]
MKKLTAIALAVCAFTASSAVHADEIYTFVVKKQEAKAKHRWSLSEWITTRDKMRMMDLWLALHSPSPYEFYLGTEYGFSETGRNHVRFNAAAYASIFGLEVQKSILNSNEWLGLFMLRIMGYHAQATNITMQAGLRSEFKPDVARNALAGIAMSIYITRFFGIDGFYRHHFLSVLNADGYRVRGHHVEGGVFIDFKFVRIYGMYYYKPETIFRPSRIENAGRSGVNTGIRLYF